MTYEGVTYVASNLKDCSKNEFIKKVKHHFEGDPKAKEKIDELYKLIKGKPEAIEKEDGGE